MSEHTEHININEEEIKKFREKIREVYLQGDSIPLSLASYARDIKPQYTIEEFQTVHRNLVIAFLKTTLRMRDKSVWDLLEKEGRLSHSYRIFFNSVKSLKQKPHLVAKLIKGLKRIAGKPEWQKALYLKQPERNFIEVEKAEKELKKNFPKDWFLIYLLYLLRGREDFFEVYRKELGKLDIKTELDLRKEAAKRFTLFQTSLNNALGASGELYFSEPLTEKEAERMINQFLFEYGKKILPIEENRKLVVEKGYSQVNLSSYPLTHKNAYLSFLQEVNRRKDIEEYINIVEDSLKNMVLYPFNIV
jgi:hypothetical protein